MKLGDTIESAMWLDGRETNEQRTAYEHEVCRAMSEVCVDNGFMHSAVRFHVKHPYDDRVPPVPDHIKGTQARLLVAEADITSKTIETTATFVSTLEEKDLATLRKITKRAYCKSGHVLNDHQLDQVIELLGPETIRDILTQGVN